MPALVRPITKTRIFFDFVDPILKMEENRESPLQFKNDPYKIRHKRIITWLLVAKRFRVSKDICRMIASYILPDFSEPLYDEDKDLYCILQQYTNLRFYWYYRTHSTYACNICMMPTDQKQTIDLSVPDYRRCSRNHVVLQKDHYGCNEFDRKLLKSIILPY